MSRNIYFIFFLLLYGCDNDVTNEITFGKLKKGVVYTLKKDVFLRVYNETSSLHPPNTKHWAPITIEQFKENSDNDFFIKDVISIGTLIKFIGVTKVWEPIANQSLYHYYGKIMNGKHSGKKVIIYDLVVSSNKFSYELAMKYLK